MQLKPPFGWSGDRGPVTPVVQGTLPDWLKGTLMRTAPAVYSLGEWKAGHWFDGLALIYAFEFGSSGSQFRQRLLESDVHRALSSGDRSRASFDTAMVRGFWNRLFHPIPTTTDNTNVNIVPWDGAWLTMTETSHQHLVDGATLQTHGAPTYRDDLGKMTHSAHPFPNPGVSRSLVNVAGEMGRFNHLVVYRQDAGDPVRKVEAKVKLERLPYVHSFGVSPGYVTLVEHPLTVSPRDMLWSNRGFIEHFAWRPESGGRLWLVDRKTGQSRPYDTESFFCFHTINQFEDGDDVVLDFLAWKDASIVGQLRTSLIEQGHPPITAQWVRARMKPGQQKVDLERMHAVPFEFPVMNLKRSLSKPTQCVWGATIAGADAAVVKITPGKPEQRFTAAGWTHGEPVMVPRPGAETDDDGVLLAVACHADGVRSALFVLDAASLRELARVEVDVGLPLGFHGSFKFAS